MTARIKKIILLLLPLAALSGCAGTLDVYRDANMDFGAIRTVAVLPLARNRPEIVSLAQKIATTLRPHMQTVYDDTAAIGRLYRRQDEVGTLWCVTVDHQSAIPSDDKYDGQVTVRDRDTMEQIRVPVDQVKDLLVRKLSTA